MLNICEIIINLSSIDRSCSINIIPPDHCSFLQKNHIDEVVCHIFDLLSKELLYSSLNDILIHKLKTIANQYFSQIRELNLGIDFSLKIKWEKFVSRLETYEC